MEENKFQTLATAYSQVTISAQTLMETFELDYDQEIQEFYTEQSKLKNKNSFNYFICKTLIAGETYAPSN